MKQSEKYLYKKHSDILTKYELKNVIEKPTRDNTTLKDHIITSITEKVSNQDVLPSPTISGYDAPIHFCQYKGSPI